MIAEPFNQPQSQPLEPINHRGSPERRLTDSGLVSINIKSESSSSRFKSSSEGEFRDYVIPTVDDFDDFFVHLPEKMEYLSMLKEKHKFYDISPEVEIADPELDIKLEKILSQIIEMEKVLEKEEDELLEVKVKKAAFEGERDSLKYIADFSKKCMEDTKKEISDLKTKLTTKITTEDFASIQKKLVNGVSSKTESEVKEIKQYLARQIETQAKVLNQLQAKVKKLQQQRDKEVLAADRQKKLKQNPEIVELHHLIDNYQRQLKRLHEAIDKRQKITFH